VLQPRSAEAVDAVADGLAASHGVEREHLEVHGIGLQIPVFSKEKDGGGNGRRPEARSPYPSGQQPLPSPKYAILPFEGLK